jgi:hypothetical protein
MVCRKALTLSKIKFSTPKKRLCHSKILKHSRMYPISFINISTEQKEENNLRDVNMRSKSYMKYGFLKGDRIAQIALLVIDRRYALLVRWTG